MKLLLGMILAAALCGGAQGSTVANAKLIGLDRTILGRATFQSTGHGVLIEIDVKGLVPGPHAILLHATGLCDPATQFASAGSIFSIEADRPHGYLAKGGPRSGDLPMQFAAADGTLHASIAVGTFTLGNGAKSIFDSDGTSIVIHANGDDYLSQPDGHAGARVACGTIIRSPGPQKHGRKHR